MPSFCASCGTGLSPDWNHCPKCGQAKATHTLSPATTTLIQEIFLPEPASQRSRIFDDDDDPEDRAGSILPWSLFGIIAGGLIGFLLRPSIPIVGQLPFSVVITRGSNLDGVSQLLLHSTAQTSFDYMAIGALVGTFITTLFASFKS